MSLGDQWHAPAPNLRIRYVPSQQPHASPQQPVEQGLVLDESEDSGIIEITRDFQPLNNFKEINLSDVVMKAFEVDKDIELPVYCHSISVIGDYLWCTGLDENKVIMVNMADGDTETHALAMMEHPSCIIDTSTITGRLLIGCCHGEGLHEVDIKCGYRQRVHKGSICDGTVYNDEVYALQYQHHDTNTSHILVFKHNGTEWTLQNDMELDYCRTSHNDTIAVNKDGIHISSWSNNNVFLYDFNGVFIRYEATMPYDDPPPRPRFCQRDDHGSLLLTDSCHGKVRDTYM